MTIRNPSTYSAWRFHLEAPDGNEFVLADYTLHRLVDLVIKQLSQFDSELPGFTKKAREEAANLGMDWEKYINVAIQNQVCARAPDSLRSGLCWSGLGDRIHQFSKGIDKAVAASPRALRSLGEGLTQIATKLATGQPQRKLGGCMSCGGRKTFAGNNRNLGRKEILNNL